MQESYTTDGHTLIVAVKGDWKLEEQKRIEQDISTNRLTKDIHSVLLDLSEATTTEEMAQNSHIFNTVLDLIAIYGNRKFALVISHGNSDDRKKTFFETVAENRNFRAKGFYNFQDALEWTKS